MLAFISFFVIFFNFLALFCNGQISHQQHKGWRLWTLSCRHLLDLFVYSVFLHHSVLAKLATRSTRVNPFNAAATFVQSTQMQRCLKTIQTLSCWYSLDSTKGLLRYVNKPLIALNESSQMSTHMPGFQWFFLSFTSFCIGQISHQQH